MQLSTTYHDLRARYGQLPHAVLQRVIEHVWRSFYPSDDSYRYCHAPTDMVAFIKTFVALSRVCTTWADAVMSRELWRSRGAHYIGFGFWRDMPDPRGLSASWVRFIDEFAPEVEMCPDERERDQSVANLEKHISAGRVRFKLDIRGLSYDQRLDMCTLWAHVMDLLRGNCRHLSIHPSIYDRSEGENEFKGFPPLHFQIGLKDLVLDGPWPELRDLSLSEIAGGYTVRHDESDGTTTTASKLARFESGERTMIFPKLSFFGCADRPSALDLDLVLAIAPKIDHFFFCTIFCGEIVGPRTPFLFRDREFRLYLHDAFVHAHRWSGPKDGRAMIESWKCRAEMSLDPQVSFSIDFDSCSTKKIMIVEKRDGRVVCAVKDVYDIARTQDLHSIPLQVSENWWNRLQDEVCFSANN